MMKQKLPKNWVVLNSKSYQNRVYYFNVKTNESSWEVPTMDQSEQAKKKSTSPNTKRKRSEKEYDVGQVQPVSPKCGIPEENITTRKKLVARRLLRPAQEKLNEQKDTPQMQALREKILKKKEKSSCPKIQSPRQSKNNEKSLASKSDKDSTLKSKDENATSTKETCTPQMQAILQKMQERASKSTPKAKKVEESGQDTIKAEEEPIKVTRSRRRDTIDSSTIKRKPDDSISVVSISIKKGRKSLKKNLGKERMEKLRKSLSEANDNDSSSQSSCALPSPSSSHVQSKLPTIYKNAEVRLIRLKDRLSKDKISINKSLRSDKLEESRKLSPVSATTVDDLVKRSNENSLYEEMDWEPMPDEKVTFEVHAVRTRLCTENNTDTPCNVPSNNLGRPLPLEQKEKRQLYIVVDTNVFLTNIEAIELAKDATFKTYDHPVIVIPWTVIRELDYIKDDNGKIKSATLCAKARKAVNYINKHFSAKHPRVIGQTPEDVARNKKKFSTDCPDDEILQTCLQIHDLRKSVVLLSYDKNLCNKAMIYDIMTLGRNDPLEKIDYLNVFECANESSRSLHEQTRERESLEPVSIIDREFRISNEMFEDMKSIIRDFMTVIVSKEMHVLYGDSWEKYVIIRPPWTAVTVLQCAIKHWIAAISDSFERKAEVILKELLEIFKNVSGERTLKEVGYILDKCKDLLQMVKMDQHHDLMLRVSQKIDELRQKCHNYQCQINEQKLCDAIGVENDFAEQERRAQKAFQYFETAYVFSRDMCGLAAETVGMPCSFHYRIPNSLPVPDYVKQIQPELAINVNKLLHTLSAVIEQADSSCVDYRALNNLHQSLVTFLPEFAPVPSNLADDELVPLDVYCCLKQKKDVLKTGLRQLQELSTHFCRLASYRCT